MVKITAPLMATSVAMAIGNDDAGGKVVRHRSPPEQPFAARAGEEFLLEVLPASLERFLG